MSKKTDRKMVFKGEKELPYLVVSFADTMGNKTGLWRSLKPVIDREKCTSCMLCWKFCPDSCIKIVGEKPEIDLDYCKGCGICAEECPRQAIKLVEEKR